MSRSFSPSLIVRLCVRCLEYALAFVLFYTGFLYLYSRLMLRRRVIILFYHEVRDVPALGGAALGVRTFERQMELVARWRRGISLDDLHEWQAGHRRLPPYPVIVTFDGGYRGVVTHAVPVLRRYGIPATIYLVTGYIDSQQLPHAFRVMRLLEETCVDTLVVQFPDGTRSFRLRTEHEKQSCCYALMRRLNDTPPDERESVISELSRRLNVCPREEQRDLFLTWDEIAAANADELIRFESHSISHPNLLCVPAEQARREIAASKEAIEQITDRAVTSFCYPMGFYSAEIKAMVREAGYRSATTVRFGSNGRGDDPFELKRIAARDVPLYLFATELCGIFRSGAVMEALDRVKRRMKGVRG